MRLVISPIFSISEGIRLNQYHNQKRANFKVKILQAKKSYEKKQLGFLPRDYQNEAVQIREMMPLGLAHIYMFDGEKIERSIDSKTSSPCFKLFVKYIMGNILLIEIREFH